MKIRHHGDFHLGQMLIVKDDVFIIDFEGEPRRSIEDRRRKAPAGVTSPVSSARSIIPRPPRWSARSSRRPMSRAGSPLRSTMARALGCRVSRRLSAIIEQHEALAAIAGRRRPPSRLLPAGEGVLRNRIRARASARLAAGAVGRHLAHSLPLRKAPQNEFALAGGLCRHRGSPFRPFRYLGPHVEGDVPLVRIFLPDAEGVAIVDEQGHLCRQLLQVNRRPGSSWTQPGSRHQAADRRVAHVEGPRDVDHRLASLVTSRASCSLA